MNVISCVSCLNYAQRQRQRQPTKSILMSHSSKLQKIRKNVYLKASATNTTLIIITLPSAFINYSFVNIIYF